MSVSQYSVSIEWAWKKNEDGILKAVHIGAFKIPSQQIEPSFYDTSNFSIFFEKDILMSNGAGEGDNIMPFEITFIRAMNIKNEEGWISKEKIFSLSDKIVKKQWYV